MAGHTFTHAYLLKGHTREDITQLGQRMKAEINGYLVTGTLLSVSWVPSMSLVVVRMRRDHQGHRDEVVKLETGYCSQKQEYAYMLIAIAFLGALHVKWSCLNFTCYA